MSEIEVTSSSNTRKSRHSKSPAGVRHRGTHTTHLPSHGNDTSNASRGRHVTHHAAPTKIMHHGHATPAISDGKHSHETHDQKDDGQNEEVATEEPARRKRAKVQMRRLNLNLTESLYHEIEELALAEGRTMTEVLRIGLGLVHLAVKARRKGGQMAIIDSDNNLHRVVLPH